MITRESLLLQFQGSRVSRVSRVSKVSTILMVSVVPSFTENFEKEFDSFKFQFIHMGVGFQVFRGFQEF